MLFQSWRGGEGGKQGGRRGVVYGNGDRFQYAETVRGWVLGFAAGIDKLICNLIGQPYPIINVSIFLGE